MAAHASLRPVNNAHYARLGDRWYGAEDDPIALLRAEARARNPWIAGELRRAFGQRACDVLDVGCGAGFLANALAAEGHRVVGIDQADEALAVAAAHDATRRVRYERADALALPYRDASFDAACAMDFLEHVEAPEAVVAEVSRVLRPGGLFFFHTFDRTWLSWLVVIKGVEWFVRNVPKDMHVLRLFVRPTELAAAAGAHGMTVETLVGFGPAPFTRAFLRMLATGVVGDDFRFRFTKSTRMGYTGFARKRP